MASMGTGADVSGFEPCLCGLAVGPWESCMISRPFVPSPAKWGRYSHLLHRVAGRTEFTGVKYSGKLLVQSRCS